VSRVACTYQEYGISPIPDLERANLGWPEAMIEHDPVCAYKVADLRSAARRTRRLQLKMPSLIMATEIASYAV
jgi:hypothetical protein